MQKLAILMLAAALSIVVPVGVLADHGMDVNGRPCATSADAVAVGPYYVSPSGPAVYEESNNMPGLQRGSDPSQVIPNFPDVVDCSHPDTIVV